MGASRSFSASLARRRQTQPPLVPALADSAALDVARNVANEPSVPGGCVLEPAGNWLGEVDSPRSYQAARPGSDEFNERRDGRGAAPSHQPVADPASSSAVTRSFWSFLRGAVFGAPALARLRPLDTQLEE